jgi:hypothetical protein
MLLYLSIAIHWTEIPTLTEQYFDTPAKPVTNTMIRERNAFSFEL